MVRDAILFRSRHGGHGLIFKNIHGRKTESFSHELDDCAAKPNVNQRQENDKEMVSNLLAFRARLDVTVDKACDANESYRYKLKEAWEGFLNAR